MALAEKLLETAEEAADVVECDKAKEYVNRSKPPAIERPFSLLQQCHHGGPGVGMPRFCRMPTIDLQGCLHYLPRVNALYEKEHSSNYNFCMCCTVGCNLICISNSRQQQYIHTPTPGSTVDVRIGTAQSPKQVNTKTFGAIFRTAQWRLELGMRCTSLKLQVT
jgi:hypothetical protein